MESWEYKILDTINGKSYCLVKIQDDVAADALTFLLPGKAEDYQSDTGTSIQFSEAAVALFDATELGWQLAQRSLEWCDSKKAPKKRMFACKKSDCLQQTTRNSEYCVYHTGKV